MNITWRQAKESYRALSLLTQCAGLSAAKAHRIGQIFDATQKIADELDRKQRELLVKHELTGNAPYPAEKVEHFEQEFCEVLDLVEPVPDCILNISEVERLSILVNNQIFPNPLSARDIHALSWLIGIDDSIQ